MNSMLASAAAVAMALVIAACSRVPASPEGAAKKMLRAYGGSEKMARLGSFAGKGFIKDWSSTVEARSFPFDVYRKGMLYKHKIMSAQRGTLTDVIVVYYDGTTSRAWVRGKGVRAVPAMELDLLKYRFPGVIQWVQGSDRRGEMLPVAKGEAVVRLRFRDGDDAVTLALDRKSWLLSSVEVSSSKDSSAVFLESYDHYTEVDGIPFPQEFKAGYGGDRPYEYILVSIELGADLPDSLFRVTAADTMALAKPPAVEKQAAPKR